MNPLRFATLAVLLAIISVASPVYGDLTVVSDGTFNNSDWTQTPLKVGGPGPFTAVATQNVTGGNPGDFRLMTDTWGDSTQVFLWNIYTPSTYNPKAQGAIGSINYSEDHILILTPKPGSDVVGWGSALVQNGVFFNAFGGAFGNFGTWKTGTLHLTAADFFSATSTTHPDFSAAGAPIQFGYLRTSTHIGPSFTSEHGIDNWKVTISPVPEPSSLWLAMIGGLGLITAWRRTRKPAAV